MNKRPWHRHLKFEDLKDGDIVTFRKHNGKGYRITYRTVKIHNPETTNFFGIERKVFSYESYTGLSFDSFDKDAEIVNIVRGDSND